MFDASPRADLLALLAAVKAEPDDDTPKLALADWLQEQDYPAERARGEYLRTLVACDRLPPDDPARPTVLGRLHELWRRNYPAWLGPLPAAGFRFWHYSARWGLLFPGVDGTQLVSKKALAVAGSEEYAWVAGLSFSRNSVRQHRRFVRSPLVDSLIALRYDGCVAEPTPVVDLARAPGAAGLKSLALARCRIGLEGSGALAGLSGKLRELSLGGCDFGGDAGFKSLCDSLALTGLRSLDVSDAGLSIHSARAFADAAGLPELAGLNLGGRNSIGPDGTLILVHGPNAGRLCKLGLGSNGVADYGVEAIARRDHLCRLTHLGLSDNRLTDRSAAAIAGAEHLASLRELDLRANTVGERGALSLAGAKHLDNLLRLDLSGNAVGPKGAAALKERFGRRVILG